MESTIHHIGLEVDSLDQSIHHFQEVLCFEVKEVFQIENEKIAFLEKEGCLIEIIEPLDRCNAQPEMHIALKVENIEKIIAEYEEKLEIEEPVTYANGMTSAFMKITDHFYIEWLEIHSEFTGI